MAAERFEGKCRRPAPLASPRRERDFLNFWWGSMTTNVWRRTPHINPLTSGTVLKHLQAPKAAHDVRRDGQQAGEYDSRAFIPQYTSWHVQ